MQATAIRLSLVLCSLLLAACGGEKKDKPATQVAARVNSEEISVHQINNALPRTGALPAEQAKVAGREVLEKLIDQELLVQRAVEKKLDRDPRTMQAIDAGRKQILSQAYMRDIVAAVAKPTAEEVKAYYDQHPELFAERRIYRFQQLNVNAGRDQVAALQQQMTAAKSINQVVAWLNENKLQYTVEQVTKPAEQLPMQLLPRFAQMKDGQVGAIGGEQGVLIIQLAASQAAPVPLGAATPAIEQFLTNQKRAEAADKELKALRGAAKIAYLGDFAKDTETLAAEAKSAADAKARAQADTETKAKADKEAKARADAEMDAKARAELKAKIDAEAAAAKEAGATEKPAAAIAVGKETVSKGLTGLR